MTEWLNVLTYSYRTTHGNEVGILQEISENTEHAIVYFPKTDESRYVHMTWGERFDYMGDFIKHVSSFRIEVIVENSHIAMYKILVNPEIFLRNIEDVSSQHLIISFLKNIWKYSVTHDLSQISSYDVKQNVSSIL